VALCAACSDGPAVDPIYHGSGGGPAPAAGNSGASGSSSAGAGKGGSGGKPAAVDPGTLQGKGMLAADVQAFAAALKSDLGAASKTTPAELQQKYALPLTSGIGYDASAAANLDLLQASSLALEPAELETLAKQGFVISGRQRFPSFGYGYASIYVEDLPVYISADSIADALHRSYDEILTQLELGLLRGELDALLTSLRSALLARPESEVRADLDTYLTVAQALLALDSAPATVSKVKAGGDQEVVDMLLEKATAAEGTAELVLFGVKREEDMSQFKPRGHYEGTPELETYFRTMIWLGRIDLRLVETLDELGTQRLNRPQVDAMLLLHSLFSEADTARFHRIDDVVRAFVGESDNMTLSQVPDLLKALGVQDAAGVAKVGDDELKRVILENGFGKQQILSHLLAGGLDAPVPLNASFLLFGQRYVVDSHVLSNVSFDRVRALRLMPDPLDVAFAALGNDQAASLLEGQIEQYDYAGNLAATRTLVDAHGDEFWHQNLYNDWLSALRALSPVKATIADPAAAGVPSVTASEAWGRRILNTQLASWAQLRHDTLLYAKQSYTSTLGCHFPDAAVDPYPEFYAAVGRFADHGYALATLADGTSAQTLGDQLRDYFGQMRDVAAVLKGIAEAERTGAELTADQLAFINDAVVINHEPLGCVSIDVAAGWYARLFFDRGSALTHDPTIADVHTQPTDEAGNEIGRILHVATGDPRLMVVTDDGCGTPRAYVGLASAYYEKITDGWKRVTDSEWSEELGTEGAPAEVKWISDLVPIAK
jgi:hypothetical protein